MGREWKPGDVAMVSTHVGDRLALHGHDGWTDAQGAYWSDGRPARPLVVIDPEDREQVERLAAAIYCRTTGEESFGGQITNVQDALREYLEPPKPEEPTGLGAVVEDTEGLRYIRHTGALAPWRRSDAADHERPWRYYDGIAAVRVLSEGVRDV